MTVIAQLFLLCCTFRIVRSMSHRLNGFRASQMGMKMTCEGQGRDWGQIQMCMVGNRSEYVGMAKDGDK